MLFILLQSKITLLSVVRVRDWHLIPKELSYMQMLRIDWTIVFLFLE